MTDALEIGLLKRKADWVGLVVSLKRDVQTKGGTVMTAGLRFSVNRNWGGLSLRRPMCPCCKVTASVLGISQHDVNIVERIFEPPTGGEREVAWAREKRAFEAWSERENERLKQRAS